ncbi:transglutaminaseTgpA domain-containing protein [Thermoflexus sp.]|uniref:transglutaminase family protein n=1 Tax=Thermoflexus sp. TaxID=1969742 RepID=UPI002ADDA71D|nr:transglutaminaseTgpA domain-containing protein [Thermoflexus sp.]
MVGESPVGVSRASPVAPIASRGAIGTLWMLFLLLLMNGSAAWTVTLAGWADGLEILPLVALGGLFIGWILAVRRFSGPVALVLNLGYGTVWVGYLSARLIPDPDWSLKLQWLGYRLTVWAIEAMRGGRGSDPLPFVVLMAALIWLAASASAWYSFRTIRSWRALLPAGLIAFINAYYYLGPRPLTLFLIAYLLGALLWLVTVHYEEQSYRWRLERIWFVPDLGVDILRAGLMVATLTVALAWLLPAAGPSETVSRAWSEVSRPLRRSQETFNRLFSSLRSQRPAYISPLSRTLSFGGPRRLSDTPVMDVRAQGPARYWRGVVYDVYTSNGWLSSGEDEQGRAPMTALTARPLWEGRAVVTQTFDVYLPGNTLIFAAQHPVAASLPSIVQGRFTAQAHDLMMIRSTRPFGAQQTYEVISLVPVPDIESLRQAGTVYPEWVQRYLQLPSNLDPRIRRLAERITAGYDNPYDKVVALEAWLRRNIRYNENIPAPPPGRDGVVYVLFDIRQGYCDYYASAMAVMARALGIPARVVSGYAQGEWMPDGRYRVRQRDAHTWVEVYFPGFGWVEFEPTAAQPPILRPQRPLSPTPTPPTPDQAGSTPGAPRPTPTRRSLLAEDFDIQPGEPLALPRASRFPTGPITVGLIGVLGLLGLAFWIRDRRRLRRLSPAAWDYLWMNRAARLFGIRFPSSWTPLERADYLGGLIPEVAEALERVAERYSAARFGGRRSRALPPPQGWLLRLLVQGFQWRLRQALAPYLGGIRRWAQGARLGFSLGFPRSGRDHRREAP